MELALNEEEQELLLSILERRHREMQKRFHTRTTMNSRWSCAGMRSFSSPC